jgi:hypothetical protein
MTVTIHGSNSNVSEFCSIQQMITLEFVQKLKGISYYHAWYCRLWLAFRVHAACYLQCLP